MKYKIRGRNYSNNFGSSNKNKYNFNIQMYQNLLRQAQAKLEDIETTSFSSHDSARIKHDLITKDLYDSVVKQLRKNQQKLQQVIRENPHFSFNLYRPKLLGNGQAKQNLNGELLEKQLDRLMEDECGLDKQLSKIEFKNQEDEQRKQLQTSQHIDHYQFLRTVWMKGQKSEAQSDGKIQELNRKVVIIKNHIKASTQKQRQSNTQSIQLQKYIKQSKQYIGLKRENEQLEEQIRSKQQLYNGRIQELERYIKSLKEENEKASKKYLGELDRLKKKDDQMFKIMQKYQALQLDLLKKEKQLKKLHYPTHTGNSNVLTNSENLEKVVYVNKCQGFSLHIILQPDALCTLDSIRDNLMAQKINNVTTKSLCQIKNYLSSSSSSLEGLIQSKFIGITPSIPSSVSATFLNLKSDIFNLQKKPNTRTRNAMERTPNARSQIFLGSSDKRKRFQRTRFMEGQETS